MTSHKGPPTPLVGPYHTAPPYSTASPLSRSQTQSHHGALPSDVSEPMPKRQRLDDAGQRSQSKALGTNLPTAYVGKIPAMFESGGVQGGSIAGDSNPAPLKQSSIFPIRPSSGFRSGSKQQGTILAIERAAMRQPVQTKAYMAEPPASAPRYQKSGSCFPGLSTRAMRLFSNTEPADFFPWTGHHPEDVLNELTLRNGFYDKLPASQNESLTAKPSILLSLKTKSGLQILSSVFASALDQRQVHGKITTASTFKPPPRVTLTDTKKEAWLRDLANSAIPLRRLSRTIPHGIRGKILLDHCLSKDIPTSRAIWLVKCVGANEIRACKRKGTSGVFAVGGEAKWIQDWTTAVEQFLETIMDSCGSEHWKTRLNYGLRLISHIYAEDLLDHEHYSRWLVNRLATCGLDNLPVWLLIMNIHKQDLLRCRQHGRNLVEALLVQLNHVQKPINNVVYDFVLQEVVKECRALMASHPECFLLPRSWKAYQDIIQDYIVREDTFLESRFNDLLLRNRRLEDRAAAEDANTCSSPERSIVATLDSLARMPDYAKAAGACLRASMSHEALVETCIQWASSTYRYGQSRVYAAARLLRIWSEHSVDLQNSVFGFLSHSQDVPNIDQTELYRLFAELVSSKHLSVGRYFQWLMASGALHKRREKSLGDACEVRFLRELPLHDIPDHILNLRRSLLSSLGIMVELEESVMNAKKFQVASQLPGLFLMNFTADERETGDSALCSLSRTLKSEMAWWIRRSIAPRQREGAHQERYATQETASRVTEEDFHKLRHIFEDLQEYGVFVDIILVLVKATTNGALLTAITDTVNFHFDTFNALDAAKDLFHALFSQRKLLPSQDSTESSFTHGLIDLATCLPSTGPDLRRLRKEEISLDPKQSAAAPSPISDNMVEAVHSDTPTFFEEMDQILTNGTSMDQPTLTRCFGAITGHLEMSWDEAIAFPCRYPELLGRLRAFDPKSFDSLATLWLDTLASQKARPSLSTILVPMVCHKVCTLSVILDRVSKLSQDPAIGQSALIALELLEMLSSVQSQHMPSVEYRSYRFLHQQQNIVQTHAESLIPLVHHCILEARTRNGPLRSQAEKLLGGDNVKSFIRMIISQISIEDKPTPPRDSALKLALKDILSQEELPEFTTLGLSQKISLLLDNVSNFNRPLSQLRLQIIIESTLETEDNTSDLLTDLLMQKLEDAPQTKVTLWSYVVSNLPAASALSIHERAEEMILSGVGNSQIPLSADGRSSTHRLMDIVVATSFGIPDAAALSLLEQISERLHKLVGSLSLSTHKEDSKFESDKLANIVDTLLQLLTVHQAMILNPKFPQSTLSRLCLSLAHLYMCLATSSHLTLINHIFDILAIVSDALLEDTRSHCIEVLSSSQRLQDPRISFIFSNAKASSGGKWLQLVSKAALVPDATTRQPYSLRRWEMVQDATPVVTENDTSLSLTLFGARKSVL